MNKAILRILSLVLVLATGLAFTLAFSSPPSAAATTPSYVPQNPDNVVRIVPGTDRLQPSATPTPIDQPVSHPGSTDGITIMSVAIVLIILLPILIQRSLWAR